MFRVIPLGVGDAFSEERYGCCLALECDDELILVDCPHPIRKMMKEGSQVSGVEVSAERVGAVVLTHLHADHASGLESLAYYSFFVLRRRLILYTHPHVLARLWEGHLAAGMEQLLLDRDGEPVLMGLDSYFDVRLLSEGVPVVHGRFSMVCHPTIHHIPTFALKIAAGGRVLGVSADTCFDPVLLAWLGEADKIVHETNYGIHTPYQDLVGLPGELRARMRLTHYPDGFDVENSAIQCLEEGRVEVV